MKMNKEFLENLANCLEKFISDEVEKRCKKLEDEKRYWKAEKSGNDKKQLLLKILANSFFGSYGGGNTPEQITRGFCLSTSHILAQITLLQNDFGIGLQLWLREIFGLCEHGNANLVLKLCRAKTVLRDHGRVYTLEG